MVESLWLLLKGIARRWFFWAPAVLLDPLDLYDIYIKPRLPEAYQYDFLSVMSEYFFHLLSGMILCAAFCSYHELKKERDEKYRKILELERRWEASGRQVLEEELSKMTQALNLSEKKIKALENSLKPRRITGDKKDKFVARLHKYTDYTLKLFYVDHESRELADDIYNACKEAGVSCSFPTTYSGAANLNAMDHYLLLGQDQLQTTQVALDFSVGLGNGRVGQSDLAEKELVLIIGKKPVDPNKIRGSF